MDVEPFNDDNMRMALKYCIDRDEIVQKIFLGHAIAGNDNPIPTVDQVRDRSAAGPQATTPTRRTST